MYSQNGIDDMWHAMQFQNYAHSLVIVWCILALSFVQPQYLNLDLNLDLTTALTHICDWKHLQGGPKSV